MAAPAIRTEDLTKDYGSGHGVFGLDPGDFELYDQLTGAAVLAYFAQGRRGVSGPRAARPRRRPRAGLPGPLRGRRRMTGAAFGLELRLRARSVALAGIGLMAVAAITGALFPSFGETLGKVELPEGVGELLGGGDFSTIAGWLDTEIASVYGPLVVAGSAIAAAAATLAGEEERRILALVLAHPVSRTRLLLAKAAAIAARGRGARHRVLARPADLGRARGRRDRARTAGGARAAPRLPRARLRSARARRSAGSAAAARWRRAAPPRWPSPCTSSTGSRPSPRTGCSTSPSSTTTRATSRCGTASTPGTSRCSGSVTVLLLGVAAAGFRGRDLRG